ncbi:phage baseplate assembly protein V [Halopenitus sp. H-Gu1]|uniref:phage baseplate assembly protein V n=1 Tax=Halopenitus sp. H-Gu1 TaxID=3242697 RepID=UPI00359CC9DC
MSFAGGRGGPSLDGVAVGIVTDNEDPEGMGRVKLEFPWRDASDESYWARVTTPMAGDDMGTFFLPEVGNEVLVAFENGDVSHPYVLGALWNGQEGPPEDNADGKNDVRQIKSRSGHELTFDDNDTAGKVEIETNAGHTIVLDDASGGEKITIEDESGQNRIEFDAVSSSVSIEAGAKLTIEAPQIEVSADGNLTIDASGMLTLKGAVIQLN